MQVSGSAAPLRPPLLATEALSRGECAAQCCCALGHTRLFEPQDPHGQQGAAQGAQGELLEAVEPTGRGQYASPEDEEAVEKVRPCYLPFSSRCWWGQSGSATHLPWLMS